MTSITVFTYGDPDPHVARDLGRWLSAQAAPYGGQILGQSEGTGNWQGAPETCGSLVVAGLDQEPATYIGSLAAALFRQDAVGVVHNAEGRTLATPHAVDALSTAEEVWS